MEELVMSGILQKFSLDRFEELVPIQLRNFPEFWTARFADGKRSYPYDLQIFTVRDNERIIGTIGIHDYDIVCGNTTKKIAGICDVGIDPDHRGKGLARQMLTEVIEMVENDPGYNGLALYTEKPYVYFSSGFELYASCEPEIPTAPDFKQAIPLPATQTIRDQILKIYTDSPVFSGKCLRTPKLWQEIFEEKAYSWQITDTSYALFKGERLLEYYTSGTAYAAPDGLQENKVMTRIPEHETELCTLLKSRQLIFPAADVF